MRSLATLFFAAFLSVACFAKDPVRVSIKTSKGEIIVELNAEKAPVTVENFLQYVDKKFYDETVFHRVIPDFMIQGGGFDKTLQKKKTSYPIKNEAGNGLSNKKYTIAMARTGDPNSATAQFFINTVDNPNLDRDPSRGMMGAGYAVFGKVVKGQKVVDALKAVKTISLRNPNMPAMIMSDVPEEALIIQSIRRVKKNKTDEETTKEKDTAAATSDK